MKDSSFPTPSVDQKLVAFVSALECSHARSTTETDLISKLKIVVIENIERQRLLIIDHRQHIFRAPAPRCLAFQSRLTFYSISSNGLYLLNVLVHIVYVGERRLRMISPQKVRILVPTVPAQGLSRNKRRIDI